VLQIVGPDGGSTIGPEGGIFYFLDGGAFPTWPLSLREARLALESAETSAKIHTDLAGALRHAIADLEAAS
jgi:hypothetical protein